ncbi:serine/threonine-protein kinase [Anaeromyxobacter sp. Fw109-5]|uniref:serine/threonine-protein kinase n=1 Tax=Anaeromyxobacter sp. (strain Fw109-5) TaxID=404589 RepID=UPI0013054336|nr:serine/threonine-protein kinase [Anaeromyxobacter sp. Fw109-5]
MDGDEQGAPQAGGPRVRPGAITSLLEQLARAPDEDGPRFAAGDVIGSRFELVREIGRGGFGVVFEARDRQLDRAVAFKAIRRGERHALRERLLRGEAEAVARLSHPNLVALHDVGQCDRGSYLILELLRGRTLGDALAEERLSPAEAVRVALEIAKGVAHAHAHGVVHRDLKPANVFLCDDGQVKVLDFGLAHAFGRPRTDGGTPAYMAPEQEEGAPEDERTDVFALGAILHEMLAGPRPDAELGSGRRRARAPALDVPGAPALGRLVARMLEPRASARPRDATEVVPELLAIEAELMRSRAAPSPTRVRTRRGSLTALVAGAVAGVALVAWILGRAPSWRVSSLALWSVPGAPGALRAADDGEAAASVSVEAYGHFVRGVELRLHACDLHGAEQEQRRAIALDPGLAAARMELGTILANVRGNDFDPEADAQFRAAYALADRMPEKERAIVRLDRYVTEGQMGAAAPGTYRAEALRLAEELVRRYPLDGFALFYAAYVYGRFGGRERAVELYDRALVLDPGQCWVAGRLIGALRDAGRWDEAMEVARRAASVNPIAENVGTLALLQAREHRTEAVETARQALRAEREPGEAALVSACALGLAGHVEEAEETFRRVEARGATEEARARARQRVPVALAEQGRVADALRGWREPPRSWPGGIALARARVRAVGRPRLDAKEALPYVAAASDHLLYAGELAFHGDERAARRAAAALEEGSAPETYHRAIALANAGRHEQAIPLLRSLVASADYALVPALWQLHYLLGESLLEDGRPAEALEALRRIEWSAMKSDCPSWDQVANYPRAQLVRARAYEALGRCDDAAAELDRLLARWRRADPDLPLVVEARAMRARLAGAREAAPR